jgi:hypothetical protein
MCNRLVLTGILRDELPPPAGYALGSNHVCVKHHALFLLLLQPLPTNRHPAGYANGKHRSFFLNVPTKHVTPTAQRAPSLY